MTLQRTVLGFDLARNSEAVPLDQLRPMVEAALGCSFEPGRYRGIDADLAGLLGMSVALYQWRGQAGASVFLLNAEAHDDRLYATPPGESLEFEVQDISESIASLLRAHGAGEWRIPTDEDIEAGRAYRAEYDERFEVSADDIRRFEAGG